MGREIKTFTDNFYSAGKHIIEWNANNNSNQSVSAGIYFCRLKASQNTLVHKMILLDGFNYFLGANSSDATFQEKIHLNNDVQRFTMRISGDSIAKYETNLLTSTQDTTIDFVINKIFRNTIGSSGGSISIPGCEISFPQGVFNSDYDISINQAYEENPFPNNAVSHVFELNGLPNDFSDSILISLDIERELSNESFVLVGTDGIIPDIIPELDNPITYFSFFNAEESGEKLTTHLSATDIFLTSNQSNQNLKKATVSSTKLRISSVSDFLEPQKTKNFTIYCPFFYYNYIEDIKTNMENNFNALVNCNESFAEKSTPPIILVIGDIKKMTKDYTYSEISCQCLAVDENFPSNYSHTILLDENHLSKENMSDIKVSTGKALFSSFYYKDIYKNSTNAAKDIWLFNMMSCWLEKFFTQDVNYISPKQFIENEIAPFDGIFPNTYIPENKEEKVLVVEEIYKHGAGMSSLLDFLVNQSNNQEKIIGYIYNSLKERKSASETLFNSYVWQTYESDWPWFCEKYVNGEIFNVNSKVFQQNLSASPLEVNNRDTSQTFHDSFIDLSAKIYQVNFNSPNIDSIIISVDKDNVFTSIFGLKYDDSVEEWNNKKVGDVFKKIAEGYDQILIVVANNNMNPPEYRGLTEVNLKINVKTKPESNLEYNRCHFSLGTGKGTWYRVWADDTVLDGVNLKFVANGTFTSDNTFEGNWTSQFWPGDEINHTGSCKIIINPSTKEILSFSFTDEAEWYNTFYEREMYRQQIISGNKAPLYPQNINNELYYYSEPGHSLDFFNASDLIIIRKEYTTNPDFEYEYRLINFEDLPNNTILSFHFYKEE